MPDNPSSPSEKQEADFRAQLGMRLVIWSTAALVALAVFMIIGAFLSNADGEVLRVSQLLLSSLMPLFASWVGTVLAFYYTKENFESATRGTMDIVRSVSQRLATTQIKDVMMARSSIIFQPVSNNLSSIPLAEIEQKFTSKGTDGSQISRLHFFDKDNKAMAILHRSVWSEMIVAGLRNTPPVDMQNGLFSQVLPLAYSSKAGDTFEKLITKTMAFVALDRTLTDAKAQMESIPGCQDVIVTQTGLATEPVLGWISNIDIGRMSQAS